MIKMQLQIQNPHIQNTEQLFHCNLKRCKRQEKFCSCTSASYCIAWLYKPMRLGAPQQYFLKSIFIEVQMQIYLSRTKETFHALTPHTLSTFTRTYVHIHTYWIHACVYIHMKTTLLNEYKMKPKMLQLKQTDRQKIQTCRRQLNKIL